MLTKLTVGLHSNSKGHVAHGHANIVKIMCHRYLFQLKSNDHHTSIPL